MVKVMYNDKLVYKVVILGGFFWGGGIREGSFNEHTCSLQLLTPLGHLITSISTGLILGLATSDENWKV